MILQKLYTYKDSNLDREIVEIVTFINNQFNDLPVFADNTAALAGGLEVNSRYRTATGQLMVVY